MIEVWNVHMIVLPIFHSYQYHKRFNTFHKYFKMVLYTSARFYDVYDNFSLMYPSTTIRGPFLWALGLKDCGCVLKSKTWSSEPSYEF